MRLTSALIAALLLALAACAAPVPTNSDTATTQPAPASPTEPSAQPDGSGGTVAINRSCQADADCAVKNVGNCCGYYPACVNVDSPTDPKGVQAECQKKGMMSVCGFPDISSCSCRQGRCEADPATAQ